MGESFIMLPFSAANKIMGGMNAAKVKGNCPEFNGAKVLMQMYYMGSHPDNTKNGLRLPRGCFRGSHAAIAKACGMTAKMERNAVNSLQDEGYIFTIDPCYLIFSDTCDLLTKDGDLKKNLPTFYGVKGLCDEDIAKRANTVDNVFIDKQGNNRSKTPPGGQEKGQAPPAKRQTEGQANSLEKPAFSDAGGIEKGKQYKYIPEYLNSDSNGIEVYGEPSPTDTHDKQPNRTATPSVKPPSQDFSKKWSGHSSEEQREILDSIRKGAELFRNKGSTKASLFDEILDKLEKGSPKEKEDAYSKYKSSAIRA